MWEKKDISIFNLHLLKTQKYTFVKHKYYKDHTHHLVVNPWERSIPLQKKNLRCIQHGVVNLNVFSCGNYYFQILDTLQNS